MAKRKSTVLLEHCLKQLKVPTILRDYGSVAAICSRENVSFEEFLLRLCERELAERQQRAMERRIKAASFPTLKTIESFKFDVQPGINEPLIRELLVGEFIGQRENVLLIGNPGLVTYYYTSLTFWNKGTCELQGMRRGARRPLRTA